MRCAGQWLLFFCLLACLSAFFLSVCLSLFLTFLSFFLHHDHDHHRHLLLLFRLCFISCFSLFCVYPLHVVRHPSHRIRNDRTFRNFHPCWICCMNWLRQLFFSIYFNLTSNGKYILTSTLVELDFTCNFVASLMPKLLFAITLICFAAKIYFYSR